MKTLCTIKISLLLSMFIVIAADPDNTTDADDAVPPCLFDTITHDGTFPLEITSPNFPDFYPSNCPGFLQDIKVDNGELIILDFLHFRLEDRDEFGNKTDYLEIGYGRARDNYTSDYFYGTLPTPFTVISKARRVRFYFHTNEKTELTGFRILTRKINEETSCDFQHIQSNRTLIHDCDNFNKDANGRCNVECRPNYVLKGVGYSQCIQGMFTPVECELNQTLIRQCETSLSAGEKDCPYTVGEIIEYYDKQQLTEEVEDQGILAESRTPEICQPYCLRSRQTLDYQPIYCGEYSEDFVRVFCFTCRVYHCVGSQFFG